jgi:hypothetical protein
MALIESQSNDTASSSAGDAIREGSVNSMKVDYPTFRKAEIFELPFVIGQGRVLDGQTVPYLDN